ncbi:MAG: hypothetical protein H7306_13685 [Bacteriovorax sp.]|nr:hypothetical protein [Rhizobacter sp.]
MRAADVLGPAAWPHAARQSLRQAREQARRWGWPGAMGLICLVAALAAATLWLPALQRESDTLEASADLAEQRARRIATPRTATAPPFTPEQRFRDAFPSARLRQERLAALLALAAAHGLESKRNELRLAPERDIALDRYSVTMPLSGPYAQLRAFIEAAQARDAALSLDRLRLRRSSGSAAVVEADLGWSFYMQPPVAMPAAPALRGAADRAPP